jgi:hypothetical protein
MNRRAQTILRVSFLAAVCSTTAAPAWAYIDPGTGSLLLQGLLGSLAIAGAAIAQFRSQIARYLSKLKRKRE